MIIYNAIYLIDFKSFTTFDNQRKLSPINFRSMYSMLSLENHVLRFIPTKNRRSQGDSLSTTVRMNLNICPILIANTLLYGSN